MLKGKKVALTTVEKEDLETMRLWRNNEEFRKHFREYRELDRESQDKWYREKVLADDRTLMFAVRDLETNELVGVCGLCYINWVHRHADLSLYIGWQNSYIDDAGFAEDACQVLFQYAFGELNLHKIWTEIYEFDVKKYELYTQLGFKLDGLLRDNYFYDGRWWDSRILSILSDHGSHS